MEAYGGARRDGVDWRGRAAGDRAAPWASFEAAGYVHMEAMCGLWREGGLRLQLGGGRNGSRCRYSLLFSRRLAPAPGEGDVGIASPAMFAVGWGR